MTDEQFEEYVEHAYETTVLGAGRDAIKFDEAIDQVVEQAARDIANGTLVPPSGLKPIIKRIVQRNDDARRRHHAEDMLYLVDVISGQTILGSDNPWLDTVCVVGGGIRKAWRYVDMEDLLAMAQIKVTKAAEAAVAAADFMQKVTVVRSYFIATFGPSAVVGDIS